MESESESEVAQSCPTLSNPMDCSLPGRSVHGIFQARVLEWGAKKQATKREKILTKDSLQSCLPVIIIYNDLLPSNNILYQLSHKGSPRIPDWILSLPRGSSKSRNWTRVSYITGRFLVSGKSYLQGTYNQLFPDGWKIMNRYVRKDDVHMTNKAYKEQSVFLAVREMDIRTTLRYH